MKKADAHWNFACLVWMGSVFAMGWAEVNAVLQPVMVYFGASNLQIGLAQGALVFTLPGMLLAPWLTRWFARKKVLVFAADTLYLLPIALVSGVIFLSPEPSLAVLLIIILMAASQVAAGFGGLPNQEFFAACIPMGLRGRLAGFSSGLGGALGLGGAAIAAWVLGRLPEPYGFGALLLLGWLFCQVADSAVLLAREPATPVSLSPPAWSRRMWRAFFADYQFLRLIVAVCLISPFLGALVVFPSAYAFRDLGFEPQMAAWIAMAAAIGRILFSPVAGWITDRFGARLALVMWPSLAVLGFLLLGFVAAPWVIYGVSGLAAVVWSGFSGAMNALIAGVPHPQDRAGHFTLFSLLMVGVNSLGPVLSGLMMDQVGYTTGFLCLAGALAVACFLARLLTRLLPNATNEYY